MYSFDSLSLKYFVLLNYDFLKNAAIQKITQPSRRELILNLRANRESKKLYININPKHPHICFICEKTSHMRALETPKSPPMFCMQLRKYIEGARIKEITIPEYERILELHFVVYDEVGQLVNLCLAIEIMGKHSNVILYDFRSKNILGTAHNVSPEKSSVREVYGGIPYIYPPKQHKTDILKTSFGAFSEIINGQNDLKKAISQHYYCFSEAMTEYLTSDINEPYEIFSSLQRAANLEQMPKITHFWDKNSQNLNEALDNYFSNIMFKDIFASRKNHLVSALKEESKKIERLVKNPPDLQKALEYKKCGDLIFQYIYLIKEGDNALTTPQNETIALDDYLGAAQNAQKYYKLYSKAKGAYEYKKKIFDEAQVKKHYYEEILFTIENVSTYSELDEIKAELEECGLLKQSENIKKPHKIELTKFELGGYEIYLGKNNKQNDYLISKLANPQDIWFHAFNCPSSHVLIKLNKDAKEPPSEVLEFAAKLTKENSPAKNSGKTSIIYTKRKDLKKPPGGVLGYVIYKNEKEIIV